MQIQLYHADDGRGYTATATAASTRAEAFRPEFERILASLSDTSAGGEAGSSLPAPRALTSLGHETLVAACDLLGFPYELLSGGGLLVTVALNRERAGREHLIVVVELVGEANDVLSISAQVGDPHPPLDRWWEVVGVANEWNTRRAWPTAVVERRTEQRNGAELVLRHRVWLPGGASVEHVSELLSDGVWSDVEFWEWAHSERGV